MPTSSSSDDSFLSSSSSSPSLSASSFALATLEVNGTLQISSDAMFLGSIDLNNNLIVNNNISVNGLSTFTGQVTVGNTINSQNIVPTAASSYNLGSSSNPFDTIYANNIYANYSTAPASTANRLTTATYFTIAGAIRSVGPGAYFDGTQGNAGVILNTVVTTSSIMLQASTSVSLNTDYIAIANNSNLNKITKSDFLSGVTAGLTPIGSVIAFVTNSTPPSGWLLCNGATVSTTTYANLFAVTNYMYGGSGTSFKVPNITDLGTGIKYIIKY